MIGGKFMQKRNVLPDRRQKTEIFDIFLFWKRWVVLIVLVGSIIGGASSIALEREAMQQKELRGILK